MKKSIFSLLITIITLNSCGYSPARRHNNPKVIDDQSLLMSHEKCPLKYPLSHLCAKIEWITGPDGDQENSFLIKFWNEQSGSPDGPYTTPSQKVFAQLWMPSMGHGSSPITLTSKSSGIYKATKVFFVMPGDWEIRVKLFKGTTLVEQSQQPLTIK